MKSKVITQLEYDIVKQWWKSHNWEVVPIDALPKTGVIIYSDDLPIVAAWLYKTDSNIAWLEFMVSNPNVDKQVRGKAIEHLIDVLTQIAKNYGYKNIFTSLKVPKLISRMQKKGINVTDKKITKLVKVL